MHRRPLLDLLHDYAARFPDEINTVTRFIAFVREYEDCFERSLDVGHITGSAWVVNRAGTHTLLTHHRKLNIWLQLGGHVDGDPHVLRAATREAIEESGIPVYAPVRETIFDLDIHSIPARGEIAEHFHYDVRFALQAASKDYVVSDESHDLQWVEIENLEAYTTEESMLRMRQKWLTYMASKS